MGVLPANGPTARAVFQIAITNARRVAVAAPCWLKRIAAQIEKGKMAKARGGDPSAPPTRQPPNTI